jgi:calreticulin
MIYALGIFYVLIATVAGKVYFKENFNDAAWKDRWTVSSDWKPKSDMGEWKWTAGEFAGDHEDKGIKTGEDARFYGISAKMNEAFSNEGKDLVLQFSVKHEQDLDCGGAYIKLTGDVDQSKFGGDSPYQIMFGPDICGPSNRRTHVIFNYPPKNDNLLIKNDVKVETDRLSHLYTLHVKPDNTFEVFIDQESVKSGSLEDNWDFLLPKEIKDPAVSKPADWVDAKKIADPTDVKPAGWDDIPKEIPDAEATKPEDWDDEEDGEWEPPMVANPDYKGMWKARMIDNPDYKGEWVHPMVPNPDYAEDKSLHARCKDCTHVGFELWQVKAGTIFDDILVTDSLEEAKAYAEETFNKKKGPEKEQFEAAEEVKRAAEAEERAKAEAEAKTAAPEEGAEDEEHDEL